MAILQGHIGAVWGVALSADGALLASGSADGTVRLWDTGSGQLLASLQGHTGVVRGVALSADGQVVVSGGYDGTVRLWEASAGTCLRTLEPERRYERVDITRLSGVTAAQRFALLARVRSTRTTPPLRAFLWGRSVTEIRVLRRVGRWNDRVPSTPMADAIAPAETLPNGRAADEVPVDVSRGRRPRGTRSSEQLPPEVGG